MLDVQQLMKGKRSKGLGAAIWRRAAPVMERDLKVCLQWESSYLQVIDSLMRLS